MTHMLDPRIALVAGEASGDLLAGLLLGGVRRRWSQVQLFGIGGPHMAAQGFQAQWPYEKLAVRGYVEVLRHYREIVGIRNQLKRQWLQAPPDLFIGVDAPDFNLELALALKRQGTPTMHFVCPSVWAWRAHRIDKLRQSVDHVLCIFPFEPDLLAQHGIDATFVGHPLAQVIPVQPDALAARAKLGLTASQRVIALLPGSRVSEIDQLLARFLGAAQHMLRQDASLRFVLPAMPSLVSRVAAQVQDMGLSEQIQVLHGQSHVALAACDVTLVASGTATLEAALFKRPMVIAYHMPWLSWQIMRRQKLQPWVGLPNILCQEFVVPELLQEQATPQALAQAVLLWLDQPARVSAVQARFTTLHQSLMRDTPALATHAVEQILAR